MPRFLCFDGCRNLPSHCSRALIDFCIMTPSCFDSPLFRSHNVVRIQRIYGCAPVVHQCLSTGQPSQARSPPIAARPPLLAFGSKSPRSTSHLGMQPHQTSTGHTGTAGLRPQAQLTRSRPHTMAWPCQPWLTPSPLNCPPSSIPLLQLPKSMPQTQPPGLQSCKQNWFLLTRARLPSLNKPSMTSLKPTLHSQRRSKPRSQTTTGNKHSVIFSEDIFHAWVLSSQGEFGEKFPASQSLMASSLIKTLRAATKCIHLYLSQILVSSANEQTEILSCLDH